MTLGGTFMSEKNTKLMKKKWFSGDKRVRKDEVPDAEVSLLPQKQFQR